MGKRFLITLIIMEALVGGLALVYIVSALWRTPLGPTLAMPTQTSQSEVSSPRSSVVEPQSTQPAPEPTATPSSLLNKIAAILQPPTATNEVLCGGPPVMTILLVGSDERKNDYYYGLADSMRAVRIDFTTPGVMVLDFPRDLWVEIPDISDHYGINQGKLNQAYFYGNPGMGYYDGPGEGPGLLARTLDLNYGLQVDHYLAINREIFYNIVDAIGGVDIYLDSIIDLNQGQDGANPDLVLEPGYHHLDAELTLKLAIDRNPTIFQRARYQNIVLSALQDKLLNPAMLGQLPGLAAQFSQSVQTDLSPSDIQKLICIGQKLTKENTNMVAFPDDMFTSGSTYDPYRKVNTYTLSVDLERIKAYVADFMSGIWP